MSSPHSSLELLQAPCPAPPCRAVSVLKQLLWPLSPALTLLGSQIQQPYSISSGLAPPTPKPSGQERTSDLGDMKVPWSWAPLIFLYFQRLLSSGASSPNSSLIKTPHNVHEVQDTWASVCSCNKMKGLNTIFSEVSSSPDTQRVHGSLPSPLLAESLEIKVPLSEGRKQVKV